MIPDTPEGATDRKRSLVLKVLYGIVLLASIWVAFRSTDPDNLGDCSHRTGYQPETSSMMIGPTFVGFAGVIGIIVALRLRGPDGRRNRVLGVLAILVLVTALFSYVAVAATASMHMCD